MDILLIHHVSVTVRDLEVSRRFYRDVLGLTEIARPPFPFAGAWFGIGGSQHLHLIVNPAGTYRAAASIDTKDMHVALRVPSYSAALAWLRAHGIGDDAMRVNPRATAGFPQIYILDPDHHVIEINAETLDE
jgi:catechol 2,3-dioxygenase-like lactoylglutathione lyase family enzyme